MVTALRDGERAAIALATSRKSDLLVLDDGLARRHARLLGLTVTGTLGVLLRAKTAGQVSAVAPVVDRLDQLGFRLAPEARAACFDSRERDVGRPFESGWRRPISSGVGAW